MKCIKTVIIIGFLALLLCLLTSKSPPNVQASGNDELLVASPVLPERIASYIASHGLKIPTSISKYCGFDFNKGGNPFFVAGDFDGDGKLDYAVDVEVDQYNSKILIFLGNGQIHELGGWEFIMINKTRGTIQTMDGPVNLRYDSLRGIRCESSSVLYVYNKAKSRFDKFFTSD